MDVVLKLEMRHQPGAWSVRNEVLHLDGRRCYSCAASIEESWSRKRFNCTDRQDMAMSF